MLADSTLVPVRNLTNHTVGYKVPELNVRRVFQASEVKKLPVEEIRKLNYMPGGRNLLLGYLAVDNKDMRAELGVDADAVEFDWTEADVDKALTTEPIEVLLDALDFGPDGIKEMLIKRAVDLEIDDASKCEAISERTGADVTNKIKMKKLAREADKKNKDEVTEAANAKVAPAPKRRVATKPTTTAKPASTVVKE